MKLGIALFCTGKYRMFLDEYVKSCEKYFLPTVKKTYFIFTDDAVLFDNVSYEHIPLKKIGWPLDTLKRYAIINQYENLFNEMDYILVTNVNMIFADTVEEQEIFPTENDNWLASVDHPNHYDKTDYINFPYEKNPASTAYVPPEDRGKYLQACFVLGRKKEFFELAKYVEEQSEIDLQNSFIAIYWDESYINKYWVNVPPRILSPAYSLPDPRAYNFPFPPKIIQLEKGLHGGHDFLRSF
jgi:hypothetical protein